jgi:phosphoribosylglycinamide formyltransferase-1
MMATPLAVTVLISGRGSNMEAIARAGIAGRIPARVTAVISDRPEARGLVLARELGIETEAVAQSPGVDRATYGRVLSAAVSRHQPGLVVLAGFMKILDPVFTQRFAGRLMNIHPSLLPKYPGLHTHRRVLEAGDPEHGCTVHFVTEELDAGPRIIQAVIPVHPGDDEQALSARVQHWEHIIYPEAVSLFAQGRLSMRDDACWLDGHRLDQPILRGDT